MMEIKALLHDESGGSILTMFPFLIVLSVMIFALEMNMMNWNSKKNEIQVIADSASRAGALGVSASYAVKERQGHGFDDYHVYIELDKEESNSISNIVLNGIDQKIAGTKILSIEKNPVYSYQFPVWNSKTFSYDQRSLSTEKQYKNGNFSVLIRAEINSVWPKLLGVPEKLNVKVYSQSTARGKVTGY